MDGGKQASSASWYLGGLAVVAAFCFGVVIGNGNLFWQSTAMALNVLSVAAILLHSGACALPQSRRTLALFLLCMGIATFLLFFRLDRYPYVPLGDPIRDGGLLGQAFYFGFRRDLFNWGSYQAFSNLMGGINAVSYHFFGPSRLAIFVPGCVFGLVSVACVFGAATVTWGAAAGFWGGFLLACLPVFMHFSRLELVVSLSGLAPVALLYCNARLKDRAHQMGTYVALGALAGGMATLYMSSRVVSLLFLLFIAGREVMKVFRGNDRFSGFVLKIFSLCAAFILVFGPRFLFTDTAIFFGLQRVPANGTFSDRLRALVDFAPALWKMFYDYPIHIDFSSPFPGGLFTSTYGGILGGVTLHLVLFLVGLGTLIAAAISYQKGRLELFFIFGLPLVICLGTKSVIGHRLSPILTVVALAAGVGASTLARLLTRAAPKQPWLVVLLYGVFFLGGGYPIYRYFTDELETFKIRDPFAQHYVSQIIAGSKGSAFTVEAGGDLYRLMATLHGKEYVRFFNPGKSIQVVEKSTLANGVAVVKSVSAVSPRLVSVTLCGRPFPIYCPKGKENFILMVEEPLVETVRNLPLCKASAEACVISAE